MQRYKTKMPLTYWRYLQLDRMLDLQHGTGNPSPDELHFIVVHQTFELWFKLILSQLRLARDQLASPKVPEETIPFVVHHLGRINEILRLGVEQFRVMETLPPQDFLAFRDTLFPASGFQSFQLREVEILLGLEDSLRIHYAGVDPLEHIRKFGQENPEDAWVWERVSRAREEVTVRQALHAWLARTPIHGSAPGEPEDNAAVDSFLSDYYARSERYHQGSVERLVAGLGEGARAGVQLKVEAALSELKGFLFPIDERLKRAHAGLLFIESYRDLPLLAWPRLLLDTIVEVEEQLILFRHRHARMVERTIGRRIGTGGSSGVEYLDKTTSYRLFPELWQVRSALLPRELLPPVRRAERYGFAG
jgi:tryptophan 2,3-dioxygenase